MTGKTLNSILNDVREKMDACATVQWRMKQEFDKHHWYVEISARSESKARSLQIHGNGFVIERKRSEDFFTDEQIKAMVENLVKCWNCKEPK